MKVLKFGGTSVANAQNIKLVLDSSNQAKQDQLIVVVSALSKVTDLLHLASLAASTDESYKEIVADIEKTFRCRQRIDCRQ
jgi:aspartokinase/homoserine dehydrogenase 1